MREVRMIPTSAALMIGGIATLLAAVLRGSAEQLPGSLLAIGATLALALARRGGRP